MSYWFEWICESPFWTIDDFTFNELGTLVDLENLPLSNELKQELKELCEMHDCSLDWDDPRNPSPWTENQKKSFNNKAISLYLDVCRELSKSEDNYKVYYNHDGFKDEILPTIERLISAYDREYYTRMLEILETLNLPNDYLCLVNGVVHNLENFDFAQKFNQEYVFLTIGELISILKEEDFQWIWGTICIIEPKYSKEEIMSYEIPKDIYEKCTSDLFLTLPILQNTLYQSLK